MFSRNVRASHVFLMLTMLSTCLATMVDSSEAIDLDPPSAPTGLTVDGHSFPSESLPEDSSGNNPAIREAAFFDFNERLAYRWAPIHSQDTDQDGDASLKGKSDFITNINFDGDWDTLNNWENTPKYSLRAYVYYSVVATKTHWFIVYAFYHPRDWADWNSFGWDVHENDLEGFLAIVKRPPAFSNDNFGNLLGIVTVCHNDFYSYIPIGSPLTDGPKINGKKQDIDGTVKMRSNFDGLLRPRTAQTAKSHCLKVPPHVRITGGDGIRYHPKGFPQVPSSADEDGVGYQLLNIFSNGGLWSQRGNPETFHSSGNFRGDNGAGENKASPPWEWNDKDDGVNKGELATDPAHLAQLYFSGLGAFSRAYTYNTYRGISCTWPEDC